MVWVLDISDGFELVILESFQSTHGLPFLIVGDINVLCIAAA